MRPREARLHFPVSLYIFKRLHARRVAAASCPSDLGLSPRSFSTKQPSKTSRAHKKQRRQVLSVERFTPSEVQQVYPRAEASAPGRTDSMQGLRHRHTLSPRHGSPRQSPAHQRRPWRQEPPSRNSPERISARGEGAVTQSLRSVFIEVVRGRTRLNLMFSRVNGLAKCRVRLLLALGADAWAFDYSAFGQCHRHRTLP